MGFESIDQPSRSLEVERNPKTSISLFWLERGGRWGSSPYIHIHFKLKFTSFLFRYKSDNCSGKEGGGVDCKMYLVTSLSSIAFMFSPISISGGGGIHQLEPKCHFDLRSKMSH